MKCEYYGCNRRAKYFMGWSSDNGEKKFGFVCPTHDKELGRSNLMRTGLTLPEAIAFDKYAKETEEGEMDLQQETETLKAIKDIIQEYADCQDELDLHKTAVEVYEMARADLDGLCPVCGAHKANYREAMGRECSADHGIGSARRARMRWQKNKQ